MFFRTELRREAVTAAARMLERTISCISHRSRYDAVNAANMDCPPTKWPCLPRIVAICCRYNRRVADAIGGLLQVGIADDSPEIRLAVLQSLHPTFDTYLAQVPFHCLLLTFHCRSLAVHCLSLTFIGVSHRPKTSGHCTWPSTTR